MLFTPIQILRSFLYKTILNVIKMQTFNKNPILNLSLLYNLSPETINLFKSNKKFNKILYKNPQIILPIKCYTEHITILYKTQNITITM